MNARRAVAAGVSVVLVVLAFVVRGAIDDDDSEASPTTTIATVDGTDPAGGDTGTDATGTDSAGAATTASRSRPPA